ncbi:MAG TPA: hypothetical protein VK279_13215 [Solirubrobacteraceae bacterium]|nr:hypothetical protein [Solirubrobacteraceae bacterium]
MAPAGQHFVVQVTDRINAGLAGHGGCTYTSPPQPRPQALELVRVLLGCPRGDLGPGHEWSAPVAGGRRRIELVPATPEGQTSLGV